ncbi:hypothetical protein [Xenorhabdus bovienii]|uniref:hypothetical protein n=1 Tax=Xenorhabdus bovienii TaxID=40576 RepID=UPI0023B2DC49|nr:hypothetical protein [Xenorhabdus bovienii]MDE9483744.1 hypothetical protein [Xenorhabdus bovienii]
MSIIATEIQRGGAYSFFSVLTTYVINKKQFMFGQSKGKSKDNRNNYHFIQEILQDGKLGNETEQSNWPHYYDFVTILEDIDSDNKYLFCTSADDNVLSLFELTVDGKTKHKLTEQYLKGDFKVLTPYLAHGKLFIYSQKEASKDWQVISFDYISD